MHTHKYQYFNSALQKVQTSKSRVWQSVAVCCSMLQSAAVCCSLLQCL